MEKPMHIALLATLVAFPWLGRAQPLAQPMLELNFRNAPLDLVLDHFSATAHLIIHKEVQAHGTLDLQSKEPLPLEQALQLLNSALKRNGCTIIRDGRILSVVSLDSTKTSDLEVVSSNDPTSVEKSDEVITQIIPVRFANASQLLNNLQILLPTSASLTANESANSLILVATKTQVRRMLRIISAIDNSMAHVSTIKVLPLRYADAKQLASVIQQLFSSQESSQIGTRAGPFNFGFGPPGFGGPPGAATTVPSANNSSAAVKVIALADEQSNSLILSASAERLPPLVQMVRALDRPVADITEIRVFNLKNADPTDLADHLSQLFADGSKQNANENPSAVVFGAGPPGASGGPGGFGGPPGAPFGMAGVSDNSATSTRAKKQGQVVAVADPRTSSLLVSAASSLMPHIAQMVEELERNPARKEIVQVYDLHNADPQDISPILQELFNRSGTTRNNNNNSQTSLLGQGNPLTTRQTQQQNTATSTTSGLGNSGARTGAGGTGGAGGF